MTDSISAVDAFNMPWYYEDTGIDEKYDINGDGHVNVADYHTAMYYLSDTDPSNDVEFSKEELETAFAEVVKFDAAENKYKDDEIENANQLAEQYTKELNLAADDPAKATTLLDVQKRGAALAKKIKHFKDIHQLLTTLITQLDAEIEDLENDKEQKEEAYAQKETEINTKTAELQRETIALLEKSQTDEQREIAAANSIISRTVEEYKNGKYPNQSLEAVIVERLSQNSTFAFDVSNLKAKLANCDVKAAGIKRLCTEITNIVKDIRDVTTKINDKNSIRTRSVNNRTAIGTNIATANRLYQAGYQKQIDLREALVKKYKTQKTGSDKYSSSNAQVQKLNEFLTNKELSNMTYADAVYVIKNAFDDCGITIDNNGAMSIPKGHDGAGTIFNGLITQIKDCFNVKATEYTIPGEQTTPGTTTPKVGRNDPISFNVGDIKYDFIKDNNKNGTFDDKSEFLGAKNGWQEIKEYDSNSDGKISDNELNSMQLLAYDQSTGEYDFVSAKEAGINSIDLNSYTELNKEQINGNLLAGQFNLSVNGKTVRGEQTFDTAKNLDYALGHIYGTKIEDQEELYKVNPFTKAFVETLNTKKVILNNEENITSSGKSAQNNLNKGQLVISQTATNQASIGEREKEKLDEERKAEKEKENEKEELKKKEKTNS